jgi:hypothetical protein
MLAVTGHSVEDSRGITLPEYVELMRGWNEVHETDDDPVAAPDPEIWQREQERLRNSPITKGS